MESKIKLVKSSTIADRIIKNNIDIALKNMLLEMFNNIQFSLNGIPDVDKKNINKYIQEFILDFLINNKPKMT